MTTQTNQPIERLRDGKIQASIWRNQKENGVFYSVEFTRSYKINDEYHKSTTFSGSEILQLIFLAYQSYTRIFHMKIKDRAVPQ